MGKCKIFFTASFFIVLVSYANALIYEIEPNNDRDHAQSIYNAVINGDSVVGQLSSSSDNDYYSLGISKTDVIRVFFYKDYDPRQSSWSISIEDISGNVLAQKVHYGYYEQTTTKEIMASTSSAGIYFIRVKINGNYNYGGDANYQLTVTASHPVSPPATTANDLKGIYDVISWTTLFDNGLTISSDPMSSKYGRFIVTEDFLIFSLTYKTGGIQYIDSDLGNYHKGTNSITFYGKYFGTQTIPHQFSDPEYIFTVRGLDSVGNLFTSTIHCRKLVPLFTQSEILQRLADLNLNNDGKLDIQDIIFGLQVLSGLG